jgi:hypothetical protein
LMSCLMSCFVENFRADDVVHNKPVWPIWAVGVLSWVRDVDTYLRASDDGVERSAQLVAHVR